VIVPLEWRNGSLRFLDQTKLPFEELYIETDEAGVVAEAIKRLAIRGAPLIGIAAAYAVALAGCALQEDDLGIVRERLSRTVDLLASTRPTAVNLFWALKRQQRVCSEWQGNSIDDLRERLIGEARAIHREDAEMCEAISSFGVKLLPSPASLLTHCNTGSLATGGRGTAAGIITKAWELGRLTHVYIDETRPLLQGARLTAWEMKKRNIPATLIVDSTAAFLMQQRKIDAVIVGADRIAMNGDVANKIGTYALAVSAHYHGIPFYVAAPVSTIDARAESGRAIPIEERSRTEVTEVQDRKIAMPEIGVYSPAFDVTPNQLISAVITDRGVARSPFSESFQRLHIGVTRVDEN
jgi:methylthioribose-1-phosphate isomerase